MRLKFCEYQGFIQNIDKLAYNMWNALSSFVNTTPVRTELQALIIFFV